MIVIPMAGLSSRFFKAGFTVPKYMLQLGNETVFEWSVKSFERYFKTDHFIFVTIEGYDTPQFVEQKIQAMGIAHYEIIVLKNNTLGQADTVLQGIQHITNDEELFIFNIDSRLEQFEKRTPLEQIDGYLEVFDGEGEHWSFVLAGEDQQVLKTTEKNRISSLCSNGLYYFKSAEQYKHYVLEEIKRLPDTEVYIAPLYNQYIQDGLNIVYEKVELEHINFCGTPQEYAEMLQKIEGK